MSEKDYLDAVGSRCSISDNSPCVRCKAVHEACKYIHELEAESKQSQKALASAEKVIEGMDFQSGCSWCEKNNEIRNKYEE